MLREGLARYAAAAVHTPFVGDRADDVAVWDGLTLLPFRQRAAIVMRYWQGMEELEIAHALGVRPGTVGSLLTRARRNLETRWGK